MAQQVNQLLEVLDTANHRVLITLEVIPGMGAHLVARDDEERVAFEFRPSTLLLGSQGSAGGLLIRDQVGAAVFNFNATTAQLRLGALEHLSEVSLIGNLTVFNDTDFQVLNFESSDARLTLGSPNEPGDLVIKDSLGQNAIRLDASGAEFSVGNRQNAGELLVRDAENRAVFFFRSDFSELRIGERGNSGDIILLDERANEVMHVGGENGTLVLGTRDNGGTLLIKDTLGRESFSFDTGRDSDDSPFLRKGAFARIGTRDSSGELVIKDDEDRSTFKFTSDHAKLEVGARGKSGRFELKDENGNSTIVIGSELKEVIPNSSATPIDSPRIAKLKIGARDREGHLIMKNSKDLEVFSFESDEALIHIGEDGKERILIDGSEGDIRFKNADVAEQFQVTDKLNADPGTVMVLGDDGRLSPCIHAYDRRVAGVVAGAGHRRPGIIMDSGVSHVDHAPISVFGKVCCKADASMEAIAVGDLLTTSNRPGYAKKAKNIEKAFGAVIGKALTPLKMDTGMIEVLVSLQ